MKRVYFLLLFVFVWGTSICQENDENKFAYLTADLSYLGIKSDDGFSSALKLGIIGKRRVGGSIGYASILESRTTPSGGQAKISNACFTGGIQLAFPELWAKGQLGLGGEISGLINFRQLNGGTEHDLVYLRSDGIFLGFDFSLHVILVKVLRLELGYFSGGEVRSEDAVDKDDKDSILPRLQLGAAVMIPIGW